MLIGVCKKDSLNNEMFSGQILVGYDFHAIIIYKKKSTALKLIEKVAYG